MKALFFFFCMMVIPSSVFAGPFGTNMGDKKEEYLKYNLHSFAHGSLIKTMFPPVRHPDFDSYELWFQEDGLCHVHAKSASYDLNTGEVARIYKKIKEQLRKYGIPSEIHECPNIPGYFLSYMLDGGSHETIWTNPSGDIAEIKLAIIVDGAYFYLTIDYYYANSDRGMSSADTL